MNTPSMKEISRDPADGRWCLGRGRYFDAPGDATDHFGSPGQPNPPCAEPVDFCRLQFPPAIDGAPGDVVRVYGRLYEARTPAHSSASQRNTPGCPVVPEVADT